MKIRSLNINMKIENIRKELRKHYYFIKPFYYIPNSEKEKIINIIK